LSKGASSSLEAQAALALSVGSVNQAFTINMRAPLGVYNVSISRVCGKVERLVQRLEELFKATGPSGQKPLPEARAAAIDYMELAVYAAAEHVDDVDAIAKAYFSKNILYGRDPHVREFEKTLQRQKRFLAMLANYIKHSHSRLRLCSVDFFHDKKFVPLYGYFVEGAQNGVLGPNNVFHAKHEIFSVTALPWEILTFILMVSRSLAALIDKVSKVQQGPHTCTSEGLSRAVVAAARLPFYTFDEPHPFDQVDVAINWSDEPAASFESSLYGSFTQQWILSDEHLIGDLSATYEGDGVSKTFHLPSPREVRVRRWR
jgi:hypothetical protein